MTGSTKQILSVLSTDRIVCAQTGIFSCPISMGRIWAPRPSCVSSTTEAEKPLQGRDWPSSHPGSYLVGVAPQKLGGRVLSLLRLLNLLVHLRSHLRRVRCRVTKLVSLSRFYHERQGIVHRSAGSECKQTESAVRTQPA